MGKLLYFSNDQINHPPSMIHAQPKCLYTLLICPAIWWNKSSERYKSFALCVCVCVINTKPPVGLKIFLENKSHLGYLVGNSSLNSIQI